MRRYLKQGKYTYKEDDLLGQGSFGKVFKGYNTQSGQAVALKQIQLSKLEKDEQVMKNILLSEISVMRKFNKKMMINPCPFLVRQEDVFRTDKHIYIVMEVCEGGTLEEELLCKRFKERECIEVLYCMAQGLQYMHAMGIAHRDLKPENIFISSIKFGAGKQIRIYKIGDFGFAAQKKQFDIGMGTFPYMAPQIFKKQKYGSQVDIWSMGVIGYQIMFGGLYFIGKGKWQIQQSIKEKPFILNEKQKKQSSPNYQNFLYQCLKKDPKQRISYTQLLSHPLFAQIHKQFMEMQNALSQDSSVTNNNSLSPSLSKLSSTESNKQEVKIFEQKTTPEVPVNQQEKIEQNEMKQQQSQPEVKPLNIVFEKIEQLLNQCTRMREMAENFHMFQQQTHRYTQFIQIYLLKEAYVMVNRLTYSIIHKQNHIQLSQQQFSYLLLSQNEELYQKIYDRCVRQCTWITGLFNQKYKYFRQQYIAKFSEEDQEVIRKVVDQDAYKEIQWQILQKQLRKWVYVFEPNENIVNKYQEWRKLGQECKRILQLRVKN